MKISLHDDMTKATEAEVNRLLPLVPAWRREEAMRYKHVFGQYCALKSWQMVEELVNKRGLTVRRNEWGKPYLEGKEDLYFSISHCKRGILVVVDEEEIGCDIEAMDRRTSEGLIGYTMNETEQQQIYKAGEEAEDSEARMAEEFTRLWTQKEATVKAHGTGIQGDMKDVLTSDMSIETVVKKEKKYVYSIAKIKK